MSREKGDNGDLKGDNGDFVDSGRQGVGGIGSRRRTISSMIGRDPFDDPFFNRPLGSMFGSSMLNPLGPDNDLPHASRSKGPVIEELVSDNEGEGEDEGTNVGSWVEEGKAGQSASSSKDPLIEHPDDEEVKRNGMSHGRSNDRVRMYPETRSVSFRKVTYGGIDGAYYSATTTRKTGKDGVVLEETKQADRTTGQATHRISRGIHDKGHSLTRKLSRDGSIDTMQTLHNLEEDELAGFEQAWNGNVQMHIPKWNDEFNSLEKAGLALPPATLFENARGSEHNNGTRIHSSGGGSKKVITIKIE